ncbi:MAG: WbqC family protein [Paludibacteraceae bacterium]|nr:WbqC family protein [Paludibacteraceae bacterium]
MKEVIVSSTYLGNIAYYKVLASADKVITEVHDNYNRQTFRNRCQILGPNGVETLTIPVIKPQEKTLVKDILIDGTAWQTQHWRTIEAAYNSSPFLEFYADAIMPFYTKQFRFLYDFNLLLQTEVCSILGFSFNNDLTESYKQYSENIDFRHLVNKKSTDTAPTPYYQVFKEKFGFTPNLSIIDLLMNMGPESILLLK